ncbi:MAG: flagellar motor protein MotB [bacterium]
MQIKLFFALSLIITLTLTGCAGYNPDTEDSEETMPSVELRADEQEAQNNDTPAAQAQQEATKENTESDESDENVPAQENKALVREAGALEHVEASTSGSNVILTIENKILFEKLSAEIKPAAQPILDEIAKLLLDYPERMVIVGGHADTLPTRTKRFPSNWDLSAQRAVNVVKYISYLPELDNSRLIAAGFGEYHPGAPNDTPENRAKNRRVEIILFPTSLEHQKIKLDY